MRVLFFIFVWISSVTYGQDLTKADELLKKGEWIKAYEAYKEVEKSGHANVEMYSNMAYIMNKQQKLGMTVLYLEKALQLEPKNKNVKNILEDLKMNDGIPQDKEKLSLGHQFFKELINISSAVWWSFSCILLMVISFILWQKSPQFKLVHKDFYLLALAAIFFVTFGAMGFVHYFYKDNAYIIVQNTTTHLSPDENSPQSVQLPEGSKVKVLEKIDSWIKIKDYYGDEGWILGKIAVKI